MPVFINIFKISTFHYEEQRILDYCSTLWAIYAEFPNEEGRRIMQLIKPLLLQLLNKQGTQYNIHVQVVW